MLAFARNVVVRSAGGVATRGGIRDGVAALTRGTVVDQVARVADGVAVASKAGPAREVWELGEVGLPRLQRNH